MEEKSVIDASIYNSPMANSVYSAWRSRDIGVGAAGLSTLYRLKGIPFESAAARALNKEIFDHIRKKFDEASIVLANERGSCLDAAECGILERFSYKLAIAPTSQLSSIMGVSPCIEVSEPICLIKNQAGFNLTKDPVLEQYLETKGLNHHEVWMKIASNGLETIVDKDTYEIFKGPYETNPLEMVAQAADRAIDQAQSFTLFFNGPIDMNLLIKTHMETWKSGLKTMYYLRSTEKIKASQSISGNGLLEECIMCE
jgi:ribonucleoside-diphosphate reductase alpha chain